MAAKKTPETPADPQPSQNAPSPPSTPSSEENPWEARLEAQAERLAKIEAHLEGLSKAEEAREARRILRELKGKRNTQLSQSGDAPQHNRRSTDRPAAQSEQPARKKVVWI
jgi:hypothetical protein